MEQDRPHIVQSNRQHNKTIPELEFTENQKGWMTKANLEKNCHDRSEDIWLDIDTDGEDIP
jgi:hypothetical protein